MIIKTIVTAAAGIAVTASLVVGATPADAARLKAATPTSAVQAISVSSPTPSARLKTPAFRANGLHNRGKNSKKSKSYLVAIFKNGAFTTVNKGKYIPEATKKIKVKHGYRATAVRAGRGFLCVDWHAEKLPLLNRTWTVVPDADGCEGGWQPAARL